MRVHNNTIRKYVQALLSQLNDFEVQYISTSGEVLNKKIPLTYGQTEKSNMLDFVDQSFLEKGNYNILPRSYIKLVQLQKQEERVTNKLLKKNVQKFENHQEFVFNPMPYEFTFEYNFYCRGMNEASQIIEALQTKFNPTLEIDIWDQVNLDEPTRIPVKLLDISIEDEGFTEQSTNLITIGASLSIIGNLYKPNDVTDLLKYRGENSSSDGIHLDNTRVMPIIKEVGYSIRASKDPKERYTQSDQDIQRIEMFDVDEYGKIIMVTKDYFKYNEGFDKILDLINDSMQNYEVLEDFDLDIDYEEVQEIQTKIKNNLIEIKQINFEQKNALKSTTLLENVHKVQQIEHISWQHIATKEKFQKIKQLLEDSID